MVTSHLCVSHFTYITQYTTRLSLEDADKSHLVVMASVGTGGWTLGPLLDPCRESHLVVMASVGTGGCTLGPLLDPGLVFVTQL